MTDTGFLVTNQRLIFSSPESVSYWFHLWLTNVAGGMVDLLFGRYGILPHKIAGALILAASLLATARLLYPGRAGVSFVLLGIAAGAGFQVAGEILVVHYNNLSALLFVLGAGFLAQGVAKGKRTPFLLSGLILGLNCFVRLPNLIGLGLVLVPFLIPRFFPNGEEQAGVGVPQMLAYLSGAICAAGCALGGMVVLGHLGLYLESLRALANSSAVDAGAYGLKEVVLRSLKNIAYSVLLGLPLFIGTAAISAFLSLFKRRWLQATLAGLGLVVSIALFVGPLVAALRYKGIVGAIVGLCCWLIVSGLFDGRADRGTRLAGALSVGIAFSMSVGSDTGVRVAAHAIPFMLPAAFDAAARMPRLFGPMFADPLQQLARRIGPTLPLVTAAALAAFSLYGAIWMVYRDTPFPTRSVDQRELRGVYTSAPRAAALEEGLPAIGALVPPGGTLFVFDSLPLIHFATRTVPYLANPWPALYQQDHLDGLLRQREGRSPLPVVVLARSNARSDSWPSNGTRPTHLEPVEAFLARNHYQEHWANAAFTILMPVSSSP